MHRKFRVCRLFPPRYGFGALSSKVTEAPASAAVIAAQRAALPPPTTKTSGSVFRGLKVTSKRLPRLPAPTSRRTDVKEHPKLIRYRRAKVVLPAWFFVEEGVTIPELAVCLFITVGTGGSGVDASRSGRDARAVQTQRTVQRLEAEATLAVNGRMLLRILLRQALQLRHRPRMVKLRFPLLDCHDVPDRAVPAVRGSSATAPGSLHAELQRFRLQPLEHSTRAIRELGTTLTQNNEMHP